jgi:hypothetical protein
LIRPALRAYWVDRLRCTGSTIAFGGDYAEEHEDGGLVGGLL